MTEDPDQIESRRSEAVEELGGSATGALLAFAIGAAVGVGLATMWIPKRPLRQRLGKRYRRARKAGGVVADEVRAASRELTQELRDEFAANLESARDELQDLARSQLEQTRKRLRRESKRLRS